MFTVETVNKKSELVSGEKALDYFNTIGEKGPKQLVQRIVKRGGGVGGWRGPRPIVTGMVEKWMKSYGV